MTEMEPSQLALEMQNRLIEFYGYPEWRNPLPPLDELVSTILSQNTNDVNRDKAFFALKKRYPDWQHVRDAPEEEIIDTIRVAGLANQKGPRIQKVLRQITEINGELDLSFLESYSPQDAKEWLMQFKGIGPKTAAIVLQFSLGLPAFPVDTHIYRITGRIGLRPEKMSADKTHPFMESLLPQKTYYPAHLNIIRLGREVCQARKPRCSECPLNDICKYRENHSKAVG